MQREVYLVEGSLTKSHKMEKRKLRMLLRTKSKVRLRGIFLAGLMFAVILFAVIHLQSNSRVHAARFTIATVLKSGDFSSDASSSNSVRSFVRVVGERNVLVLVDEDYLCDSIPREKWGRVKCAGIYHCMDPVHKVPTMDCVLSEVVKRSRYNAIAYVNGDLMVFPSLAKAVMLASRMSEQYVVVGRRHNSPEGPPRIPQKSVAWDAVEQHSKTLPLDHGYALDYFVFSRNLLDRAIEELPPFVIGAWRWDNSLLAIVYKTDALVVDATYFAPVLHQERNAAVVHETRRGAEYNAQLAERFRGNDFWFGSIDFADVVLDADSVQFMTHSQPDMWHRVIRKSFKANILSSEDMIELKRYYENQHGTAKSQAWGLNPTDVPFDKHIEMLKSVRRSQKLNEE